MQFKKYEKVIKDKLLQLKKLLFQIKKPQKGTTKYWLSLIFAPSLLLIDDSGKDKTGHMLTGVLAIIIAFFVLGLLFTGKANFICVIGWVALNVWGWLMQLMQEKEDLFK